jgi:hypothetical protein
MLARFVELVENVSIPPGIQPVVGLQNREASNELQWIAVGRKQLWHRQVHWLLWQDCPVAWSLAGRDLSRTSHAQR